MGSERVEQVTLRVPSDLRYGEATRAYLDTLTRRLEEETATPSLNAHVISAFGEAFNNVVWHAYGGQRTGEVEITVEVAPAGITVKIADRGSSFDIDSVEDPDLPSMPEGGLGLWIIRSLMSTVTYERGEPNVITMVKDFQEPLTFSDDNQEEV